MATVYILSSPGCCYGAFHSVVAAVRYLLVYLPLLADTKDAGLSLVEHRVDVGDGGDCVSHTLQVEHSRLHKEHQERRGVI